MTFQEMEQRLEKVLTELISDEGMEVVVLNAAAFVLARDVECRGRPEAEVSSGFEEVVRHHRAKFVAQRSRNLQ